ncbi:MAG: bifunctional pyr operon transcriptional regulator/uracil phosphoribosyltransferase [Polyangiaceae bacterium UTPRO1]|nr:bifunctional pyr operon transcriptional regulator/uracil phosphoribosyltransferase PyrR [Myxococcales bacterium]OQY67217.1 MAG: bifunctional pyr operon transcriptional regulator/uracil phosphoribosyltransferase [Polyangiaceae bacterium UTPRO1]
MTDAPAILLDGAAIGRAVARIAHQILERDRAADRLVLVGVRSRGVHLARRIAQKIEELAARAVPVGAIDITPYRDDVEEPRDRIEGPETDVAFSIDDAVVVLVDDVLATGRTVRVALDILGGLGRPHAIQVAVLVDRGNREVPIRADFVGQNVSDAESRRVHVRVRELDGRDEVALA